MANMLDRDNQHLLLEKRDNTNNSFIANINNLAAKLDVIVILGNHVNKIHLLIADDTRNTLTVFLGQHADVVVRQLVTQDIHAVADAQNRDPHRRRRDNFVVKLLVLLEAEGVLLGR